MSTIYKRKKIWQIKFSYNDRSYQKSLRTRSKTRAEELRKKVDNYLDAGEYPYLEEIIF